MGLSSSDKITTASTKPIIIGRSSKSIYGATGGLELYGGAAIDGAHLQAITSADEYPVFQLLNWAHDNITLNFDSYCDGPNWKSSSSGSNFQISKASNKLSFNYKSGIAAGSNITWSEAMNISTTGAITANDKISTASGKPIIIGKSSKSLIGATGGLELYGAASNMGGAHLQAITTEDDYPVFQWLNWAHNDITLNFDSYADSGNWKSSSLGSNFQIAKQNNKLSFNYKSGIAAGSNITWSEAMNISAAGLITASSGISTTTLTASGAITANAGVDMKSQKITNVATPTATTDGTNKTYVDTLDGQNVKLTGDQTITGIKIFNGNRNDIRNLNLLGEADFNNVDIINASNITINGGQVLNQNGGYSFFSQTSGAYQYFLYTLNTDSGGVADQRGYAFANAVYDPTNGTGLYITKVLDNKSPTSNIVRFNNAGGMRFYGALDMNSNNITSAGTISGTAITSTTITASGVITSNDNIVVASTKKVFIDRSGFANNKLVLYDGGTTSTTAFLGFGIANQTLLYNVNASSDSHVFYYAGTNELFRINNTEISASRQITLPTTSSGYLTLRQRPSYTYDPQIFMKSGGYTNYAIVCAASGTLHAWTTSNSTGEPNTGYVYINAGANVWSSSSDRRLKSDIETLDCGDCCEKLLKINCCSYYFKSDEKKEKKNHGFIADEVKKVFPEFVSESGIKADDGDGYIEGVTYQDFIPILVSAFQHTTERIVNLEKENKTLLNILQDQTNQLAELRAAVFPPNAA